MTLQQLEYFRVLARMQHYTRAAQALMVSQPSLSYAMSELEKELGVKLFRKEGRGIALSEGGRLFQGFVERSLGELDRGKNAMSEFSRIADNQLHVGYIFSLAGETQQMISAFLALPENSDVHVRPWLAHSSSAVSQSLSGLKQDVVFCTAPPPRFPRQLLQRQPLCVAVAAGHPLAGRPHVTLEELIEQPLILESESTSLRGTILSFFREKGLTPRIGLEAEECNAAAALASGGAGYAILPGTRSFAQNGLVVLSVEGCTLSRPVYMSWRTEDERPAALRFRQFAAGWFAARQN